MARAVLLACLVMLSMCLSAARTSPASRKSLRSVDCRRMVFHPYCRGVAAKRSMPSPLEGLEAHYTMDQLDPAPEPPPPPQQLRADPVLAGILDRLLVVQADDGPASESADSSWASEQSKEYGRYEWQPPGKRIKEQEISYDY